ncbi:penicillin-binding transpeptidase domain-containing protein [uncultured Roseobacter sp.]|uniref:penicillin-binding transpeptidase domain-containing protein n=1 Tax=uncultured Roseobacter sp. TaxID=114847 RepID=UPI0026325453|nr:penicillin-binding transpeptidase domain-containing protein [uncultured Roseobacter sp.]
MTLRTWVTVGALWAGVAAAEPADISRFVSDAGADPATSVVLVQRLSDGHQWSSNPARAETRFVPASTSKIPHTLIALETGLATPETVFAWDGEERFLESWNQDQTLTRAFQRSAVWVYQEIARSTGGETMARWLTRFGYGNADVGGAQDLETYWLRGPLAISAQEQVVFLARLAQGELPLSPQTYTDARRIMMAEQQGERVLHAKTGYALRGAQVDLGWYVGWVDAGAETYVFAMNMDLPGFDAAPERQRVTRHVLDRLEIFPKPAQEQ